MCNLLYFIIITILCFPLSAWGATYYVSQSGTGDGSAVGTPDSIVDFNANVFGVLDDDTVYFLGTITSTIDLPDGGASGQYATFRGDYSGQECTIDGNSAIANGIDTNGHQYINIIGFTIRETTSRGLYITSGGGLPAQYIAVSNCIFTYNDDRGCHIFGNTSALAADDITFDNCTFSYNGDHGSFASKFINGVEYTNCTFDNNGQSEDCHGASSWATTTTLSGGGNWGAAVGSVYAHDKGTADTVYRVVLFGSGPPTYYVDYTENTSTPTTPGAGEWGQSGTSIYVYATSDPDSYSVAYSESEVSGVNYTGCTFSNTANGGGGSDEGHGLSYDGFSSGSATRCLAYDNEGFGFVFHFSDSAQVTSSISRDNGAGLRFNRANRSCKVLDCTIVDNTGDGIDFLQSTDSCEVTNNIIEANGGYGVDIPSVGTPTNYTQATNCVYNNTGGNYDNEQTNTDINSDPLFLSATDFHLTLKSPCIDAGTNTGVGSDLDGTVFPVGSAYDIGAYEYLPRSIKGSIGTGVVFK